MEVSFLKFVHNCVHFLSYFLCMFFVICKAYSIPNVLISVINYWVFNCIECTEIAELKMKVF